MPEGERPRTAAFGTNGEMYILDIKRLLDVERFRKINVDARQADAVYPDAGAMAPERNLGFLLECARRISAINLIERDSGRIYARVEGGRLSWADAALFERALEERDARAGLLALAPQGVPDRCGRDPPAALEAARAHTLGQWGPMRPGH